MFGLGETGDAVAAQDDLLRLVPPLDDVDADVDVDWAQIEDAPGVELPGDYKWLVERYGPGSFNDFLYILQLGSPFTRRASWNPWTGPLKSLMTSGKAGEKSPTRPTNCYPLARRTTATLSTG